MAASQPPTPCRAASSEGCSRAGGLVASAAGGDVFSVGPGRLPGLASRNTTIAADATITRAERFRLPRRNLATLTSPFFWSSGTAGTSCECHSTITAARRDARGYRPNRQNCHRGADTDSAAWLWVLGPSFPSAGHGRLAPGGRESQRPNRRTDLSVTSISTCMS